ncbi:hypothetical protein AB7D55_000732 [Vibrio mimicus]
MKAKCINQGADNQVLSVNQVLCREFYHQDECCPPSKILLKNRQVFALLMEMIE